MSLLSGDSGFNMEAFTLEKKKVSKVCLKGWLKHVSKDGLQKRGWRRLISLGLVLMVIRLREIVLEWRHCVKSNPPQWEDPKDVPFINPISYNI